MQEKKPLKKQRSKARAGILTVELIAFVVLAVYLVGYTISLMSKPTISTEVVSYGQIESPKEYTGIIARDETVAFANESGKAFFNYSENEYIKKGAVVCVTKDADNTAILEKEINSIDRVILEKQMQRDGYSEDSDEVKRINAKIKSEADSQTPYFHLFGGDDIYRFKTQLQRDIGMRNSLLAANGDETINPLNDQKNAYLTQLSSNTQPYLAGQGGVLSYSVDGFEELVTPGTVYELTAEQINAEPSTAVRAAGDRLVEKGEPVFKIVSSNTWYIAAYFDKEAIAGWEEDQSRYLYIKDIYDTRKLLMKINKIVEGSETLVVFSSSKYMNDFINMRNVTFCLDDDSYKGLKVPNSAITEKTALRVSNDFIYDFRGAKGVYVKNDNGFSFKSINILSSSGDYSSVLQEVDGIKLGTVVYSRSPDNVTGRESFTIDELEGATGVYVANSGTAEFRQIITLAANEYYSIIGKSSQFGVKPYDRIITDASAVANNEIIR